MTTRSRPVPRATYRLQLSSAFRFEDVEGIAGYLARLGVSHVYLSPIFEARPGSTHGYDTVDHTRVSAELGGLEGFRRMAETLQAAGLGIVLDLVPNHMGIGGDGNRLWLDVLEWGRASPHASWFDIDWNPAEPSLTDKVLVPFLGRAIGAALRDGRLELRFDEAEGSFAVWAEDTHKLPVNPRDYAEILRHAGGAASELPSGIAVETREDGIALKRHLAASSRGRPELTRAIRDGVARINDTEERGALAALVDRQNWRPAHASVAADDINYRRFFIISDLAAIRVERDDVFDHVHAMPFQLVAEGLVDGLRIDHVDGLYDPKAYCLELRRKCPRPIWLVVEKILGPDEELRAEWEVDGTTGYEFAAAVNRLLTDPAGERSLTETYEQLTGRDESLDQVERTAKLAIVDFEMAAELDALALRFRGIAASDPLTADITRNALRNGLRAVVSAFSIYRTYVAEGEVAEADERAVRAAVAEARAATPALEPSVFAFIERVLLSSAPGASLEAAMRFQQYAGPVMAKGLEDTALYRFNRLISLSDVGERPDRFTDGVDDFHAFIGRRVAEQRNGMLTTSSHDSKRGEDGRARIAALSGRPDAWQDRVTSWMGDLGGAGLEPSDLYYVFQSLVGAWPAAFAPGAPLPGTAFAELRERMQQAMLKAVREARLGTSWSMPRTGYEERLAAVIDAALSAAPDNRFLAAFRDLEAGIARSGALNGLVATVLKLTVPGTPDIYQGAELWEQSMVDPDNRRAVDFRHRETLLRELTDRSFGELDAEFRSGAVKLAAVARLLAHRAAHPGLFAAGDYRPVLATGRDADRVLAFLRQHGEERMLVVVARWPWRGRLSAALDPAGLAGGWRDLLRQRDVRTDHVVDEVLNDGPPVAVLARTA